MTCPHCRSTTMFRIGYTEHAQTQYRWECPICGRGVWESPGIPKPPGHTSTPRGRYVGFRTRR